MNEATTFFWERQDEIDTDWTPVCSLNEDMKTAIRYYVERLNANLRGGRPLPARVLAVEVGGDQQLAEEFRPTFFGVKLEEV